MSSLLFEAKRRDGVSQPVLNEAANVVLAFALAAMFLVKNKDKNIKSFHVLKLLDDNLFEPDHEVVFNSYEDTSDTTDRIILRVTSSDQANDFIRDNVMAGDRDYKLLTTIINYVNNDYKLTDLIRLITNNGTENTVIIDTNNIVVTNPMKTTITIDSEDIRIFNETIIPIYEYSTGIGGIGQKELEKDYGHEAHRLFLNSVFNLDIDHDSGVYYQTVHNNGNPTVESLEKATRTLYEELCKRINNGLGGMYDSTLHDFKYSLITGMLGCSFGLPEEGGRCLLIPENDLDSESFDVAELVRNLYETPLIAKCPENLNPSIRIIDGDKNELFQLRLKKEAYPSNLTGYRYKLIFKASSNLKKYYKNKE